MIRFLFKGLLRDRSRSLFPVLVVVTGVLLTVVLYSWIKGIMGDIVRPTAAFTTGHVRVVTRAYLAEIDQLPNDLALTDAAAMLGQLRRAHPEMLWTPRIHFGALLDIPNSIGETRAQGPVAGLAVDLLGPGSREPEILNLKQAVVRGRLPQRPGEVVVSDEFARRLGIEPGASATLIGSTMNGSMAVSNFTVSGTIKFGVSAMDRAQWSPTSATSSRRST